MPGKGIYQLKRMPFGSKHASATFQQLMDKIITPKLKRNVFYYLDDIIIVTKIFEEHLKYLETLLEKINEAKFIMSFEKCEFGCSEVKYLGFVVDEKGLQIDENKIVPIPEFPTPKNVKQLQRIIGMTSWYRKFIPKLSEIIEPLQIFVRKGVEWEWDTQQELALRKIKQLLTTGPILTCPDLNHPFPLETDASDTGLGAALTQNIDDNSHVIAFASRSLNEAEKKYSTSGKECIAVV